MPELLHERTLPAQAIAVAIVPVIFGVVTGWLLGVNEPLYITVSLLGIVGGWFAGFEHRGAGPGAIRGFFGGFLFGASILLTHEAIGADPQAHLLQPEVILVAITTGFGVLFGALGGRKREELEAAGVEGSYLDVHRLRLSELVATIGGAILMASLWMPWFATSCDSVGPTSPAGCNPHSFFEAAPNVDRTYGQFNAFESFGTLPMLLILAAVAPVLIAWFIARGTKMTWGSGEIGMVVGIYAIGLVLLNGIILGRPGQETVDVSLQLGYFVALVGGVVLFVGALMRQLAEGGRGRKPPGV